MKSPRTPRVPEFGRPDATEFEIAGATHRVADVPPMDVDGVRTVTVGTILWAVAIIALVPFWGTLRNDGNEWWLWTAIAGFGLGLVGIEYCRLRRDALAAAPAAERPAPIPAPRQASRRPRKTKTVEPAADASKSEKPASIATSTPEPTTRRARVRVEQTSPAAEPAAPPKPAAQPEPVARRVEPVVERSEPVKAANEPAFSDDLPPVGHRRRAKPIDAPAVRPPGTPAEEPVANQPAQARRSRRSPEAEPTDRGERRPGRRAREVSVEDTDKFPVAEEPYAPDVGRRRRK